jgi:hypothetical protein
MVTQFKDVVLSRGAIYHSSSNLNSRVWQHLFYGWF